MKTYTVLGSTGSIGTQTLEVIRKKRAAGEKACIAALSAHSNIALLARQIEEFRPEAVAVFDEAAAAQLKKQAPPCEIFFGMEGLVCLAKIPCVLLINALVGGVGLRPTLAALDTGTDIALANKETLVTGGRLVMEKAKARGNSIIPIDSEHSAIFQCLQGQDLSRVRRVILTASGGPFFGYSKERLASVTPEAALKHPNWSMGAKITIDSATMMNKGFEVIEAKWLFGVPLEKIEVVVHPQSVIHSMVEFQDGQALAQLAPPDMRLPIAYALSYPRRSEHHFGSLDFTKLQNLTFAPPDTSTFECLSLAYEAATRLSAYPAVLNYANEEAVRAFLDKRISFLEIPRFIKKALDKWPHGANTGKDVIAGQNEEEELSQIELARVFCEDLMSLTGYPLHSESQCF